MERARFVGDRIPVGEHDERRGFKEIRPKSFDHGNHLVGVAERHALLQKVVEGGNFGGEVGQELTIIAEPSQMAAQLVDVRGRRHLLEGRHFFVVRGDTSRGDGVFTENGVGGANPGFAERGLEVVLTEAAEEINRVENRATGSSSKQMTSSR